MELFRDEMTFEKTGKGLENAKQYVNYSLNFLTAMAAPRDLKDWSNFKFLVSPVAMRQ